MKILIADDNQAYRELIASVLENYGECTCAEDGLIAVNEFKKAMESKEPYNLVCLDINMPRMNGQETLLKMRNLEREQGIDYKTEVPITMISALDDEKHIVDAFLNGNATSYITKPLTEDKLIDEMRLYGLLC